MRPPALDDLGLRCALYEETLRYEEKGLQITFEAPETLPALPAPVEVAAYRIAQEALHNVARHAQARTCAVRLDVGAGWLAVEVVDDGIGIPVGRRSGVGLQSMHERAAELNGQCRIVPRDGWGDAGAGRAAAVRISSRRRDRGGIRAAFVPAADRGGC